jgi:hypothetical protein
MSLLLTDYYSYLYKPIIQFYGDEECVYGIKELFNKIPIKGSNCIGLEYNPRSESKTFDISISVDPKESIDEFNALTNINVKLYNNELMQKNWQIIKKICLLWPKLYGEKISDLWIEFDLSKKHEHAAFLPNPFVTIDSDKINAHKLLIGDCKDKGLFRQLFNISNEEIYKKDIENVLIKLPQNAKVTHVAVFIGREESIIRLLIKMDLLEIINFMQQVLGWKKINIRIVEILSEIKIFVKYSILAIDFDGDSNSKLGVELFIGDPSSLTNENWIPILSHCEKIGILTSFDKRRILDFGKGMEFYSQKAIGIKSIYSGINHIKFIFTYNGDILMKCYFYSC